ncbi:class I SAM-dependent methyltransferase [Natronoglycomyces albus]
MSSKEREKSTVAGELYTLISRMAGVDLPIRLHAWDGSEAGPKGNLEWADAPILHVRDRAALKRLMWRPTELGLVQAYILDEIDVEGDIALALERLWAMGADTQLKAGLGAWLAAIPAARRLKVFGRRPPAPNLEANVQGALHSRNRDRSAIAFHYDLSNDFYRLLLDSHMVYSCGYWTSNASDYGLEDAQRDKLDLICRKLGLRPGMRLLDVGCGWGALSMHAAEHYGAIVTAATLSQQQHAEATKRAKARGLAEAVDFRLCDYRDIEADSFDAICSIEMGEHVGKKEYPRFAAQLRKFLRPGGRLLIQQMSRGQMDPGGGEFIETYIVPDMHMRPLGETVGLLEAAGLEVRNVEALREHYVRTIDAWREELEHKWEEVEELVGRPVARVWRLYLVGGALSFKQGRMGVDQILATAPLEDGRADLPATPDWYHR